MGRCSWARSSMLPSKGREGGPGREGERVPQKRAERERRSLGTAARGVERNIHIKPEQTFSNFIISFFTFLVFRLSIDTFFNYSNLLPSGCLLALASPSLCLSVCLQSWTTSIHKMTSNSTTLTAEIHMLLILY